MKYTHLFFDLDGTLIDSRLGILNSVKYFMDKKDIAEDDRPLDLNPFIGPPLRDSFRLLFGLTTNEAEQAVHIYREYYSIKGYREYSVYPHVEEALNYLKNCGLSLSLVTSKAEYFAHKIIQEAGLSRWFDAVSGSMLTGERSKKHELILHTLEQLQIKASRSILMVGDRYFDVEGARAAGVSSAAVLYGYGQKEEFTLMPPDRFINSPRCLKSLAVK